MYKQLLIIITVCIAIPLGVEAQETETLFSDSTSHGVFGALAYGTTNINGEWVYLRGTRGAWVININDGHTIHVGLARYRTETNFEAKDWQVQDTAKPELDTRYGGFELEYVHRANQLFHLSLQTLVGSGKVDYQDDGEVNWEPVSDNYFVIQPGLNLNLNITNWFRMSGGVSYRYASGVELEGTSDSDLSGLTSFVALRFGWF